MRQPVQARQQQSLNARRDIDGGFIRLDPPLRAVTLQGASFNESADDLFEEKRIAARALQDATEQISGLKKAASSFCPSVSPSGGNRMVV